MRNASAETTVNALLRRNVAKNASVVTRRNVAAVKNASVATIVNALLRRNVARNASVVTRRNAAAAARNANVNISKNLT